MSNDIELSNTQLAQRLVFLRTVADVVETELKAVKAQATLQWRKGDTSTVRSADDAKLGQVTRTDPKPVAAVVDEELLAKYIFQTRPDDCVTSVTFGDPAQIVPILIDAGRTDLFAGVETIPDWLFQEMETRALAGESVPGIEVRTPPGWIQVRTGSQIKDAVRALLNAAPTQLGIEAAQ